MFLQALILITQLNIIPTDDIIAKVFSFQEVDSHSRNFMIMDIFKILYFIFSINSVTLSKYGYHIESEFLTDIFMHDYVLNDITPYSNLFTKI